MEIFNENVVQKERFRITANKLLNHCFILKKKEDTKDDYFFVIQNKDFFAEYFELLGYTIIIDETSGVIALNNVFGTGRLRLKKIESIVVLVKQNGTTSV